MYKTPPKTRLSHYLRTGQKLDGFQPDSFKSYDLCNLCGGPLYDLDIKGIRSERDSRYRVLLQRHKAEKLSGKTHKIWQTVGGSRTRQSHVSANAQKVGIDEKFRVGNEKLFLPNDPNATLGETANCRCYVRYVAEVLSDVETEEDIRDRTEQQEGFENERQALKDKLDALVASERQSPRSILARRRLHEVDPKKHFTIKSGVILPDSIAQKVSLVADEYYILTGENIVVTSGRRSAATQALAMYNVRVARQEFGTYKDAGLLEEIIKAFNKGGTRPQIIVNMTKVIQAQVNRKRFISFHLSDRAVDIRSRNMSSQQRNAFRVAANKVASKVFLEGKPPHWHLQF